MSDQINLTIPFEHAPTTRPNGYYGHGRNGSFKAAGVWFDAFTYQNGGTEITLRNTTSRNQAANHAVVMPAETMDQLATRWLTERSLFWRRILAQGIKGLCVETEAPYAKSDGDLVPERTKGVITDAMAAPHTGLILAWVDFGDSGVDNISLTALLDPDQFRLSHEV